MSTFYVCGYLVMLLCCMQQQFSHARQTLYEAAVREDLKPQLQADTLGVIVYGDCAIDLNKGFSDPAPIYTPAGKNEWLESNSNGLIEIANGAWIDMYCEKSFAAPFENVQKISVQCLQDTYVLAKGKIYAFNTFVCTSWPTYLARRTGRACNGGTDLLEVGYQLAEQSGFLKTIDICHDEENEVTRYSYHTLTPGNAVHRSGINRPSFINGDFYGKKNVNGLYSKAQQKATFSKILQMNASVYFDDSKDFYLARGHLAAKADFVYGAGQRSTFFFVNVAPQWQSFNGGNWERVETSVRLFAGSQQLDLLCYTGVWGVATLPDVNGEPRQLFLDFDVNGNGLIPVPQLYYRVVIDANTRRGIVLLCVNNPHATRQEIERDYIICNDISDHLDWLSWDKNNLKRGYSYACTVPDFLTVVHDLPEDVHNITGVLSLSDIVLQPDFI